MMFTSRAFPFILFGYLGLSEAAPRIINNALPLPMTRKPREASEATMVRFSDIDRFPADKLNMASFTGLTPEATAMSVSQAVVKTASTASTATTEPTTLTQVGPKPAVFGRKIAGLGSTSGMATPLTPLRKLSEIINSENTQGRNEQKASQEHVCNCSLEGVLFPDECNESTGQCVCLLGYTGLQCEDCEEDYYTNGTAGCLPCTCDSFGAVSQRCDSSGVCVCKGGVSGPKCDDCHPGFFHFSSTGCQPCQCNNHSTYCHPQSGICLDCQGNTQGLNCEECQANFYRWQGDSLMDACVPCPCPAQSSSGSCHLDSSGRVVCDQCLSGWGGSLCDVCVAGFYNSGGVCVPCDCHGNEDPRSAPNICDPETGVCHHCGNHTAGPHCQACASGYSKEEHTQACTPRARAPPPSTPSPSLPVPLRPETGAPAGNGTASALSGVSWTQFSIIVLAVVFLVLVVLLSVVGGVVMYREYRSRKLNAPFWTIELKEDNISFSSYHDNLPHADPAALLEEEPCVVAANGQLALAAAAAMYKA